MRNIRETLLALLGLVGVGMWILIVLGWFLNLFALFDAHGSEVWIRIAGLFIAPAGVLMGWFY